MTENMTSKSIGLGKTAEEAKANSELPHGTLEAHPTAAGSTAPLVATTDHPAAPHQANVGHQPHTQDPVVGDTKHVPPTPEEIARKQREEAAAKKP